MEYFATGFGLILGIILLIFILVSCLMWFLVPFWIRSIKNSLKNIDNVMSKFYCVYMAYTKYEVMDSSMEEYDELPTYPRDCARVRIYDNPSAQLDAYANTPCPASQLFEADSKEEIEKRQKNLMRILRMKNGLKSIFILIFKNYKKECAH